MLDEQGLLRSNGFKGFLVSDWGATHDSATDNANAGLDMEMPGDWILIGEIFQYFYRHQIDELFSSRWRGL
jgi:beta-glucosidase-like glycosyl hydrolase